MAKQKYNSILLAKDIQANLITKVEIYFNNKTYVAKEIMYSKRPKWISDIFKTEMIFNLKMFDNVFTEEYVDYLACNDAIPSPVNTAITSVTGNKVAITDAFVSEYSGINVTLFGSIYEIFEQPSIEIIKESVIRQRLIEQLENKNPFLKRFRNLLEE